MGQEKAPSLTTPLITFGIVRETLFKRVNLVEHRLANN